MNIFSLSTEEAKEEIKKMLDSVTKEQLVKELKECGLEVEEVKSDD